MNNTLIDLSDNFPKGMSFIYREVYDVANKHKLKVLVVGAMARDLVLVYGFGARLERGTRDVDFAVQVKYWQDFYKLATGLINKGFTTANGLAHRFYLKDANDIKWEVDILPFGKIANKNGDIKWPPDESIVMSVLGFDEAFKYSLTIQLKTNNSPFLIQVASPPSMISLKLISWLEREAAIRTKDAKDILYIIQKYSKIPSIIDRMYEEGFMEAQDWNEQKSSASILGLDVASQLKQKTFDYLNNALFSESEKLELLLRETGPHIQDLAYEKSLLKIFIDSVVANYS